MTEHVAIRPAVTVAMIVERDGLFLLVEEETRSGLRLNQPAGHLEAGESLPEGAARETLEESGWQVTPTALVGVYRWVAPDNGATFVRFAFAGRAGTHDPARPLDHGIVRALWLDYGTIAARRADHRSPLVMQCLDDYRAGLRYPLELMR
jgi:8-oxo-dGTP pyrophosphatase MutT (NUDIX family)